MPDYTDAIPYYKLMRNAQIRGATEDLPIIGDLWKAQNAIIDFWEYNCFPDWHVWVETAQEPVGELVIALLGFGMGDVLRGYFRPSSVRGLSGFNRLKKPKGGMKPAKTSRLAGKIRIPETGNMIGKKLPGARFVQSKQGGKFFQRMWRIDGVAQRGLWYWMVADISADFTVNWTSAIMNSSACTPGGPNDCYNAADNNGPHAISDWWPWAVNPPDVMDPDPCIVGSGIAAIGNAGHFSAGCDWVPYLGDFGGASMRIVDLSTGETKSESRFEATEADDHGTTNVWTPTAHGHSYQIQYKVPAGTFASSRNAFSMQTSS